MTTRNLPDYLLPRPTPTEAARQRLDRHAGAPADGQDQGGAGKHAGRAQVAVHHAAYDAAQPEPHSGKQPLPARTGCDGCKEPRSSTALACNSGAQHCCMVRHSTWEHCKRKKRAPPERWLAWWSPGPAARCGSSLWFPPPRPGRRSRRAAARWAEQPRGSPATCRAVSAVP